MDKPTLYVCHGDTKGAPFHPCAKVQKQLNELGVDYDKVIGGKGNPIKFLRSDEARAVVREATGDDKMPAMKLADGTVLTHSKAILEWAERQKA